MIFHSSWLFFLFLTYFYVCFLIKKCYRNSFTLMMYKNFLLLLWSWPLPVSFVRWKIWRSLLCLTTERVASLTQVGNRVDGIQMVELTFFIIFYTCLLTEILQVVIWWIFSFFIFNGCTNYTTQLNTGVFCKYNFRIGDYGVLHWNKPLSHKFFH